MQRCRRLLARLVQAYICMCMCFGCTSRGAHSRLTECRVPWVRAQLRKATDLEWAQLVAHGGAAGAGRDGSRQGTNVRHHPAQAAHSSSAPTETGS